MHAAGGAGGVLAIALAGKLAAVGAVNTEDVTRYDD
jgi:hypothetical protein